MGEPVCALGFPFGEPHLTIHQGIISAIYKSGPATLLKLDMSINASNSGGPLISMKDGRVVGVIARKATGLLKQAFDELIESFRRNIEVFESASGVSIMGIDPMEGLIVSQRQMEMVSKQIERSANVGIGYAIWIDPLRNEKVFLQESI